MTRRLIIAEKPNVAKAIAAALGKGPMCWANADGSPGDVFKKKQACQKQEKNCEEAHSLD